MYTAAPDSSLVNQPSAVSSIDQSNRTMIGFLRSVPRYLALSASDRHVPIVVRSGWLPQTNRSLTFRHSIRMSFLQASLNRILFTLVHRRHPPSESFEPLATISTKSFIIDYLIPFSFRPIIIIYFLKLDSLL